MPNQSLCSATCDPLNTAPETTDAQHDAELVAASVCFSVWRHEGDARQAVAVTKAQS